MSYKDPIIPVLTLKGVDAKIQTIQSSMSSSLTWLDKSFGLADRIVEMRNEKPYIYPATFEANTHDPIPLMPSDAWTSFCFWTKTGESKFDLQDNFSNKNPLLIYNVSCVFYVDIKQVDNSNSYKETKSQLIVDIFHFFNNVRVPAQLIPVKFIEDDITKVYEGFTLDQLDNKWKMYPKWACRMDFELSFRDDCYA